MGASSTGSTSCRSGRPTWCRSTTPIRSAPCWPNPSWSTARRPEACRRGRRGELMHAPAPDASDPPRQAEPWRRRLLRSLLYGRNVDRAAKARARIGLAILIFALGYAVITARLIMFATAPDAHAGRRVIGHDAVGTARPDILDRNGEILATDVRSPSLFGEPHRLIDIDEAVELLTAVLTDQSATELRERLVSRRRFAWLRREITPKQQAEIHRLGIPGIGFLAENKRVYPNSAEVSHL